MTQAIAAEQGYVANVGAPSVDHTISLTITSGTKRKAVILIGRESTYDVNGVTFNGNAAAVRLTKQHTTNSQIRGEAYTYDIPDALSPGSYDIVITMSGSTGLLSAYAWQTTGSTTGAPEATDSGEETSSSATVSGAGMTVTAGSITFAACVNSAASPTWDSYGGGISEAVENDEGTYTSAFMDGAQASPGGVTVTATASSTSTDKIIIAVSIAADAGAAPAAVELLEGYDEGC